MTNLSIEVEKSLMRIAGSDSLVIAELSLKGIIYYSLNNGVHYKQSSEGNFPVAISQKIESDDIFSRID